MKLFKKTINFFIVLSAMLVIILISLFIRQGIISQKINNNFVSIYNTPKYQEFVAVEGIKVFSQEVSCGYACIEMIAKWLNNNDITEQTLLAQNEGKISTAVGNGFSKEMNKQFPQYTTTRYKNLKNTELIDKIYDSLSTGTPVTVGLASIYNDGGVEYWTLHYVIVTAIDIPNDRVFLSNPYGYEEIFTIEEFLSATRYDSYENMELFLRLGFAVGLFNKNTIYIME
ncbi:UNVERIFIED_CONTAM: peptidase C39-like protein [Acetivibrio alkalicellulosi]